MRPVFLSGLAIALLACTPVALAFLREAKEVAPSQVEPVPSANQTAPVSQPQAEVLDPKNPDLKLLQIPEQALAALPRDRDGKVDWVQALRSGAIQPRGTLSGAAGDAPLDLDVIMRRTRQMPYVRFPHRAHTEWLACSNCHPALFEARAGATQIRMEDIFRGRYCGTCHDRVAFITHRNCDRCHSVPQQAAATSP